MLVRLRDCVRTALCPMEARSCPLDIIRRKFDFNLHVELSLLISGHFLPNTKRQPTMLICSQSFKFLINRELRLLYVPSMLASLCSRWSVGRLVSHANLQIWAASNSNRCVCKIPDRKQCGTLFLFRLGERTNTRDHNVYKEIV